MPKKRYNAEEIIHKLREADVLLGQGRKAISRGLQASSASPIKPTTAGTRATAA